MFRYCPSCESRNVVIYEKGEEESFCLDCAFTWWQADAQIRVKKQVLRQIAGLRRKPPPPPDIED